MILKIEENLCWLSIPGTVEFLWAAQKHFIFVSSLFQTENPSKLSIFLMFWMRLFFAFIVCNFSATDNPTWPCTPWTYFFVLENFICHASIWNIYITTNTRCVSYKEYKRLHKDVLWYISVVWLKYLLKENFSDDMKFLIIFVDWTPIKLIRWFSNK